MVSNGLLWFSLACHGQTYEFLRLEYWPRDVSRIYCHNLGVGLGLVPWVLESVLVSDFLVLLLVLSAAVFATQSPACCMDRLQPQRLIWTWQSLYITWRVLVWWTVATDDWWSKISLLCHRILLFLAIAKRNIQRLSSICCIHCLFRYILAVCCRSLRSELHYWMYQWCCLNFISVVKMPSLQYYIELDNTTVASFDTATSTAEGLVFGSTEVKLKGHSIFCFTVDYDVAYIYTGTWVFIYICMCWSEVDINW